METYRYSEHHLKLLTAFKQDRVYSPELEQILESIRVTGVTCYPWFLLKALLVAKFEAVLDSYAKEGTKMGNMVTVKAEIIRALEAFESPPFTLQRICELLIQAQTYYRTVDKFVHAFEKTVTVVTVDPVLTPEDYDKVIVDYAEKMEKVKKDNPLISSKEITKGMDIETSAI
eukprot:TRINITY_DN2886_c0_g1_i11.p1 TRINITY_DN2886_c0_g1~~TRINITY_DN2886_c0_g1_i11.p1  ORF type:complete len:173 (+),score=30.78 TRINITY_DN2886_c0_g1_i11:90-608(+)